MLIPLRRHWTAIAGWFVAGLFLVVGAPLFVRTPLWCDASLYEVAAQVILSGGVHYRDVFDTNPPGFPWMLCGVRLFIGTSSEAVRIADLAIVLATTALLLTWSRSAGASPAGVAWAAAAISSFYLFIHEFNHVQRDVWMMLPAVIACRLRLLRVEGVNRSTRLVILEGLVWGFGCWVKPHMLLVAACVWLFAAGRFGSTRERARDFATVFAGGVVAGLLGLAWLVGTGAWPYFLDVWQNWNTAYAAIVRAEFAYRLYEQQLKYFPPYSSLAILAVPLAVWNLRDRSTSDPARFRRSLLAALYLAWLLIALFLQRGFHYVHVPEVLLMLAVFAANRWPVAAPVVLSQIVVGVFMIVADHKAELMKTHKEMSSRSYLYRNFTERNLAFLWNRTRRWGECFESHPSRELRKSVGMWTDHSAGLDPVQLGAVADYLREQNTQDGELIAWHDSPHALYLELKIKPGLRFMHLGTVYSLGPWQQQEILRELQVALPHTRFAVSDMHSLTLERNKLNEVDPNGLPHVLPAWQRKEFPFNQPVVFRSPSGRYLVHRITNAVTSCIIPNDYDQEFP